jgi:predicted metalloendopeptidase
MVNAFFHTSTNTIYIPSSILTSPIVNLEHDPWYSIANLGFIIGHELCHCFDTGGLLYDCMNVYHSQSLLSKSETATYKKKIKKICKYIQTQGYTNPHISNHSFSDEIVADITGFLLTEAVLKDYYSRHHIDLHTGLDRFYKQYATLWSSANRDVIDPHDNHIPNKYRVNCVLISSEYFRTHNNIPQMYDPVFIEL